jgi:hypothetical protein
LEGVIESLGSHDHVIYWGDRRRATRSARSTRATPSRGWSTGRCCFFFTAGGGQDDQCTQCKQKVGWAKQMFHERLFEPIFNGDDDIKQEKY